MYPVGVGNLSNLGMRGRNGDTMVGHLTPGEIVIPKSVQSPGLMAQVASNMRRQGINPASFVAGSKMTSTNPMTGMPEFADPNSYISHDGYRSIGMTGMPNFGAEQITRPIPRPAPITTPVLSTGVLSIPETVDPLQSLSDSLGDGQDYGGEGSQIGTEPSGTSSKSQSQTTKSGRGTNPSLGQVGKVAGNILGFAAKTQGLGLVGAGIGTAFDLARANQFLDKAHTPQQLGFTDFLGGFLAEITPFSSKLGMRTIGMRKADIYYDFLNAQNEEVEGFGYLGGPVGGMGFDDPGAGYGFNDFGPVGGMGFDDSLPEGFAGFDDDQNSGDLSGPSSGDIDDEAAGENDMGQDDY